MDATGTASAPAVSVERLRRSFGSVRALMIGGEALRGTVGALAWAAAILLVFVPLSVARDRALE